MEETKIKEIKVDIDSECFTNLVAFAVDFYQDRYNFLENKNFKTEPIKTFSNEFYVYLDRYLNLKYFKMEII